MSQSQSNTVLPYTFGGLVIGGVIGLGAGALILASAPVAVPLAIGVTATALATGGIIGVAVGMKEEEKRKEEAGPVARTGAGAGAEAGPEVETGAGPEAGARPVAGPEVETGAGAEKQPTKEENRKVYYLALNAYRMTAMKKILGSTKTEEEKIKAVKKVFSTTSHDNDKIPEGLKTKLLNWFAENYNKTSEDRIKSIDDDFVGIKPETNNSQIEDRLGIKTTTATFDAKKSQEITEKYKDFLSKTHSFNSTKFIKDFCTAIVDEAIEDAKKINALQRILQKDFESSTYSIKIIFKNPNETDAELEKRFTESTQKFARDFIRREDAKDLNSFVTNISDSVYYLALNAYRMTAMKKILGSTKTEEEKIKAVKEVFSATSHDNDKIPKGLKTKLLNWFAENHNKKLEDRIKSIDDGFVGINLSATNPLEDRLGIRADTTPPPADLDKIAKIHEKYGSLDIATTHKNARYLKNFCIGLVDVEDKSKNIKALEFMAKQYSDAHLSDHNVKAPFIDYLSKIPNTNGTDFEKTAKKDGEDFLKTFKDNITLCLTTDLSEKTKKLQNEDAVFYDALTEYRTLAIKKILEDQAIASEDDKIQRVKNLIKATSFIIKTDTFSPAIKNIERFNQLKTVILNWVNENKDDATKSGAIDISVFAREPDSQKELHENIGLKKPSKSLENLRKGDFLANKHKEIKFNNVSGCLRAIHFNNFCKGICQSTEAVNKKIEALRVVATHEKDHLKYDATRKAYEDYLSTNWKNRDPNDSSKTISNFEELGKEFVTKVKTLKAGDKSFIGFTDELTRSFKPPNPFVRLRNSIQSCINPQR